MHVEVISLSSREIERRLDAFELDAGLTYLDNEPLGNVRTVPLYRERYVLLCAVDGPFAGRSTVEWAEAATVPLCLLTPDMQNRRILDDNFAAAGAVASPDGRDELDLGALLARAARLVERDGARLALALRRAGGDARRAARRARR